ncbi:MAG: aspartate aminotransferase family protein [Longimicrobiales bacterium]
MLVTAESNTARAVSPLLGVYRQPVPVFVAGEDATLIDEGGRRYLDFTSGIGVNALGYGAAGITDAVTSALETGLIHTSNLFRTQPAEMLAAELVARSFADRVFFCNSGGEATEGALKFARRWAGEAGGPAKHEIVALRGSFHGRLFGSLAVTDRPAYQAPFEPLMPGARFVPAGDVAAARATVSGERTAALIVEPVQGEGGVVPLDPAYLAALREIADDAGALLIFDEAQCGLGRTGTLFAYERAGVEPDILTLAKPLAGGLPMGAVLLTENVAGAIQPGDHATTFGGGPLVSTVALTVVRTIAEPGFLSHVRDLGDWLGATLAGWKNGSAITDVRGLGLIWGIELNRPAAPVVAAALEAGLLILSAGERVVRLLPPLAIERTELERGIALLKEVLA